MMEFLVYLTPIGNQIIRDLVSAKFNVRENIGYCSNKSLHGYSEENKNFVICTKNIKKNSIDVASEINRVVYHEAIHATQTCAGYVPIGIPLNKMHLPKDRLEDLNNSLKIFNSSQKSKYYRMEYEAYWLQDKPEVVDSYIKKICLNK